MAEVQQEQAAEMQRPRVWLAADYHFPSTYSCRIPMSSMNSAPVMPAPGPATVRLALVKAGIECFGLEVVRDQLFPVLRSVTVCIRPPERVAISQQVLHAYKWSVDKRRRTIVQESIIVREMAHACGPMTIFLQVPEVLRAEATRDAPCGGLLGTEPVHWQHARVSHVPLQFLGSVRLHSPSSTKR